ncbi:hypothetical protein I3760_07G167400 [Carya illinoinensis]|nr:hypothetical protein I3760_07G167400 [Carya illinoinensis]
MEGAQGQLYDSMEPKAQGNPVMKKLLLILNCILLSIGNCGGPLIMRLYFIHGGKRVWLSSWLETGGFPVILLPLAFVYFQRRATQGPGTELFFMKPPLFLAAAFIGIVTGLDDYLYAYGVARLPVSTSSLIIASQLAFTAGFAFLLVKQKFTSYSINAVFLLTVGAAVLALHTSNDRPEGESNKEYLAGFFMTLGASALYGFLLPLVELTYKKSKQEMTYSLVMEIQMVMSFFATLFCTVGMLINKDFQVRKYLAFSSLSPAKLQSGIMENTIYLSIFLYLIPFLIVSEIGFALRSTCPKLIATYNSSANNEISLRSAC